MAEAKTSPKALWLVIALLVTTNLATAILAFQLLGNLDRGYSQVLDPTMAGLRDMQQLTRESTNIHRAVLNILLDEEAAKRDPILERFAIARQKTRRLLDQLGEQRFAGLAEAGRQRLTSVGNDYLQCADQVIELVKAGRDQEADTLRATGLRGCFEAFQAALTAAAMSLSDGAVQTSNHLTDTVFFSRHGLLVFGSLPLLSLTALGGTFIIFVILLIRIFRRVLPGS